MAFEKKIWQFNDLITEHELNRIEDGIHEVHEELTPNQKAPLSLKEGIQAVNVLSNSALQVQFEGRTLVNLLGRDGNFEVEGSTAGLGRGWRYAGAGTSVSLVDGGRYGNKAQRIEFTGTGEARYIERFIDVTPGKYYVAIAETKKISGTSVPNIRVWFNEGWTGTVLSEFNHDEYGVTTYRFRPTSGSQARIRVEAGNSECIVEVDGYRVFEITEEEYNALDNMTDEEIAALYPYVDSVQHTRNPYVIAKGKNLLPSKFSNKDLATNVVYEINKPYHYRTIEGSVVPREVIEVIGGQTYTFSAEKVVGRLWISTNNNNGRDEEQLETLVDVELDGEPIETSFTVPINRSYIRVIIYPFVLEPANSPVELKNWQLELGDTATEFEPYEETYLFGKDVVLAEGERAYQNANGEWRKWQEWKQIELTGDMGWAFVESYLGHKQVKTNAIFQDALRGIGYERLVKYDGKILGRGNANNQDYFNINTLYELRLSIPNQDSGWGDSYTPTPEEIKAYFNGWQMNNGTFGQPYNGTGTKTWVPLGDTDNNRATTTLPTITSPTITEGKITHYQLHYKLAEPREVPVAFEGSLRVREGLNQIEVGTGVVVRERSRETYSNGRWHINEHAGSQNNLLGNRPEKILAIYKNTVQDNHWVILNYPQSDWAIFGKQGANILEQNYDPTAAYHVTYFVLDKHLFTAGLGGVQAEYNLNLATRLEENEKELIAQVRKVSVLENELFPLLGSSEIVDHNLHVKNPPLGYYVRWANGLQVCFGESIGDFDVTTKIGESLFRSGSPIQILYPATFIDAPSVSISLSGVTNQPGSLFWLGSDWDNNSSYFYKAYLLAPSSRTPSGLIMRFIAIGRWK